MCPLRLLLEVLALLTLSLSPGSGRGGSLQRRVVLWWWDVFRTARNADSLVTDGQTVGSYFFNQSVPPFTCGMVKGLGKTEKDHGKVEGNGEGV